MLSGSFPIFALSNHTTFSQTQTGATVPISKPTSFLTAIRQISFLPLEPFVRFPTVIDTLNESYFQLSDRFTRSSELFTRPLPPPPNVCRSLYSLLYIRTFYTGSLPYDH